MFSWISIHCWASTWSAAFFLEKLQKPRGFSEYWNTESTECFVENTGTKIFSEFMCVVWIALLFSVLQSFAIVKSLFLDRSGLKIHYRFILWGFVLAVGDVILSCSFQLENNSLFFFGNFSKTTFNISLINFSVVM